MSAPIVWKYIEDELPDADTTCLLALDSDDTDEVILGYHDGDRWCVDCGNFIEPLYASGKIYAWAYAPSKPSKKGATA